jgi:GNAT superfamily N-acetyltransferase
MKPEDVDTIDAEYRLLGWGRPRESFERMLGHQESGERTVFIAADSDDTYVGHVTVSFSSRNPSFSSEGIPEINDFNVLPKHRRQGIGSSLLDAVESLIAEKNYVAGIGVGMTPDYGSAQRMYVKRGYVPDGRGLTKDFEPVKYRQPIVADDSLVLWMTKRLR